MKYVMFVALFAVVGGTAKPADAFAQAGSGSSDTVSVPRRAAPAEIERIGQKAQQAFQANWFGGGQALSSVEGCQLTLQATRTVNKIGALTRYHFDAGYVGDSLTTRDNDSPSMVSSVRVVRRDGMRLVARDSSPIRGGVSATDTVSYVEIGAAYGNPGRRLEAMIATLQELRSACAIVRAP